MSKHGNYSHTEVLKYDDHKVEANGEGSVASAGAIQNSTVVTGGGNTLGNGNVDGNQNVVGANNHVIQGDDNVAGFGTGAVNNFEAGKVTVAEGGAISNGGTVKVDNSDSSVTDSGNKFTHTETYNSGNSWTDNSLDNSHNSTSETTTETNHEVSDSYNDFESWVSKQFDKTDGSYNVDHHWHD